MRTTLKPLTRVAAALATMLLLAAGCSENSDKAEDKTDTDESAQEDVATPPELDSTIKAMGPRGADWESRELTAPGESGAPVLQIASTDWDGADFGQGMLVFFGTLDAEGNFQQVGYDMGQNTQITDEIFAIEDLDLTVKDGDVSGSMTLAIIYQGTQWVTQVELGGTFDSEGTYDLWQISDDKPNPEWTFKLEPAASKTIPPNALRTVSSQSGETGTPNLHDMWTNWNGVDIGLGVLQTEADIQPGVGMHFNDEPTFEYTEDGTTNKFTILDLEARTDDVGVLTGSMSWCIWGTTDMACSEVALTGEVSASDTYSFVQTANGAENQDWTFVLTAISPS